MIEGSTPDLYTRRLAASLPKLRDRIGEAVERAGRGTDSVRLLAVTKGHPVEAVRAAIEAGLTDLGENRVAEVSEKVAAVGREGVRWHMIGHVQRRKAGALLEVVDCVQSVDSIRLAERLDRLAADAGRTVQVLAQVNTSGEGAKGGFPHPEAVDAVLQMASLGALQVEGLMTMAPFVDDEAVLRSTFSGARRILDEVRRQDPAVGPQLSMGMTNDLRFAVEEGSTMVRIGTALFGARPGLAGGA